MVPSSWGSPMRKTLSGAISLFLIVPSLAIANANPSLSGSEVVGSIWWVPIVAALIGAISALATPFIKDLLIQRLAEQRSKSDRQHEIFRNYAAPLASSCEKLMWRFNEIFIESRHHFLKTATLPLIFNEYKRKSTLYRIASLLGWIRAINLELSALPRGGSGFLTPVSEAIYKVQSALADGPYVELHRLEQMCTVWRLPLDSLDVDQKKSLATKFEVMLYSLAGNSLKDDSEHLKKLDEQDKFKICQQLSVFLCKELRRAPIDEAIVRETINQSVSALSYREALIYRDWQDAIGDAVLEADVESVRRFKIVGYQRFEEVLEGESLWMRTFRGSIDDIDFDAVNPNDFRAKQLRDLARGVAEIVARLSQTQERDLVTEPVLEIAQKLAEIAP
jgi:hypothetical protein